jgi:NAD(P)-dependent dehydrogenase (short-subunit alcohol dehydrogenase family)
MILQNKNAIIYGAGGSLGGAVARALAAAGAKVFLTGRNIASVQKTADLITSAGGKAEVDVVDGYSEAAIKKHLQQVQQKTGSIDISYNGIGLPLKQNVPLWELTLDEFISPLNDIMGTQYLTAIAAARVMMKQGSGVIITLTATPGGIGYPLTAGFAPACAALETFSRNLASEAGPYGVRVVNIRSGGSPDSKVFKDAIDTYPDRMKEVLREMEQDTMLKKLPLMADIANTAVFLSSDMARRITGVTIDVTAGTTAALNYRSASSSVL